MSKKKSFFERLTGSVRMDDNFDEDLFDDEKEISEEETVTEDTSIGELTVDVIETPKQIIIQAMTAGVKKNDLQITISRESVEIHGERHMQSFSHDAEYELQELYWGAFGRIVNLPDEIDVEESSAQEEHGLLTITLPKIDKNKQARLKVA